jgi:hypothetical protein
MAGPGPGRKPLGSLDGPGRRFLNPGGPPSLCTLHRSGARARLHYIYVAASARGAGRLKFLALFPVPASHGTAAAHQWRRQLGCLSILLLSGVGGARTHSHSVAVLSALKVSRWQRVLLIGGEEVWEAAVRICQWERCRSSKLQLLVLFFYLVP